MNFTKKTAQVLSLVFLSLLLFSCKESGCVQSDQFDTLSVQVESKPEQIYGTYDAVKGGQRVDWYDTGLRSNGEPILIQISGTWTSLNGEGLKDISVKNLPRCNLCSKKPNSTNCICAPGQVPEPEFDPSGQPYTKAADGTTNLDCRNNSSHQNDSQRCTCTLQSGNSTDYGVYHFPLNLLNKDETVKIADLQSNCRFDRGQGAYLALWGARGVETPIRAYHLYSEETICNITLDSNGQCRNSEGEDMTRYVFRSANGNGLMRDDQDGNDKIDNNTSNDAYHGPNENLKVIMYDQFYSDNYGKYNLEIFGGFGDSNESGLIEFLVSLIEDSLLGEIGPDGKRDGGIIRFMYQAVVQDSGFASLVQISLALYIAIFGAAHLWGLVEMNKTELLKRMMKIGLIMMFVSPTSWNLYNTFVVGFFKDGMDSVIAMFMTMVDENIEPTSSIIVAQMDRNSAASSATRFAYVDLIIKNLMSEAVAKKVLSLFFADFFGWFYIIAIYALIFLFIAIMIYFGSIYTNNLMKIIFVLAIGPIFFIFSLFKQTGSYFNNWISYLAGRAFEMIILFIILYMFLTIIDKNFTEMLSYKACTKDWILGPARLLVLTAEVNRGLLEWLKFFLMIAGLIWIMFMVIVKVPSVAGKLFSLKIGGEATQGGFGGSGSASEYKNRDDYSMSSVGLFAFGVARNPLVAAAVGLVKGGSTSIGGKALSFVASKGIQGAAAIGNATGFNQAYNSATGGGIAGMARNSAMGAAFEKASGAAGGNEMKTRSEFMNQIRADIAAQPAKMAALGINEKSAAAFLDKKMVEEPLRDFLKSAAKEMKNLPSGQVPIGDTAIAKHLGEQAQKWAATNGMSAHSQKVLGSLLESKGIKGLMQTHGTMTGAEAAKALLGDKEAQDKFRADLLQRQQEQKALGDQAKKYPITAGIGRLAGNIYHGVVGNAHRNAERNLKNFERGLDANSNPKSLGEYINPLKPKTSAANIAKLSEFLDTNVLRRSEVGAMAKDAKLNALREALAKNPTQKDTTGMNRKERLEAEKENKKNQFFRDELRKSAVEQAGFHPDREKREQMLKDFGKNDGRTLFEKAAALSQLNKHGGLNGEESQTRLSNLIRLEAKRAAATLKNSKLPEEKRKEAEEKLKKLEKGMFGTDIDQSVLEKFIKEEREKELKPIDLKDKKDDKKIDEELDKNQKDLEKTLEGVKEFRSASEDRKTEISLDSEKQTIIEIAEKADKEIREIEKEEKKKKSQETVTAQAIETPEQKKKKEIINAAAKDLIETNPSIIPQGVKFEDMFGKGLAGILLEGVSASLGLKAGQIIPGQDPNAENRDQASASEINSMKMANNQLLGQIKLAKMDIQLQEIDLEQAKAEGDGKKVLEIEGKIKELKKQLVTTENVYKEAEGEIAKLSKK